MRYFEKSAISFEAFEKALASRKDKIKNIIYPEKIKLLDKTNDQVLNMITLKNKAYNDKARELLFKKKIFSGPEFENNEKVKEFHDKILSAYKNIVKDVK